MTEASSGSNGSNVETPGQSDISTADTMRERADESRLKLWILLKANRIVVTAILSAIVFGGLILAGAADVGLVTELQSGDTKVTIFSTMLGAIITATTLVVTISQLVISQENGPLGDQHRRMSNAMDFRDYVGKMYDEPTPADPSAFLRRLVDEAQRRAEDVSDAVAESDSEQLQAEIDEFTDSLTGNADAVRDQLDGATFGSFGVLFAALNFNYSWKIFQVERIGHDYADVIDEETESLLDELRTALTMFGPAREHVKTLYFQWALINLSQMILYAAVPALLVAAGMLVFYGTGPIPGTTLGIANVLWVVATSLTITLIPFMLLVAYVSRVATVAKRTLAIGPLILRESQR